MNDHEVAGDCAGRAGALLVDLRARGASKDDGDREANELILQLLAEARPDDAVLSEESKDSGLRLERERVWIVDPLDGTREFGEPGRTDWAVHVALVVGGVPTACAVALPAQEQLFVTPAPVLAAASRWPDPIARVAHATTGARALPRGSTRRGTDSARIGRREDDGRRARHRRRVRPFRRSVRMGLGGTGRRRHRGRVSLLAPRRRAARLQPSRPVPSRLARVPPGARDSRPRSGRRGALIAHAR